MLLKIRQLFYNLFMNTKQIFGFKVAGRILQKGNTQEPKQEKALNKQWETPNPIKVNRVPKAPQVQMI